MSRGAGFWLGLTIVWIPLAFLSDGVTVLILPLRLDADAGTLGVVSLIGLGIAASLQPVAGWLTDRLRGVVDRRAFLAVAALPAIAGLWLLTGSTTLPAAVFGYVLLQTGATAMQAAQQTFIPEHLERAEQGRGSGLKAAFDVGGSFLAFLLLGALLASGGLLLAAMAITVLLGMALALVFVVVPRVDDGATRPIRRGATLIVPAGLGALIGARFLFLLGTYGVGRFLVLLVGERLGLDPGRAVGEAAGIFAVFTLVTALCAVPAGRIVDRRPARDLMVAGAAIAGIGIVVLIPPFGLGGVVAGGLVMSIGTAAFVTANWAATAGLVPRADAGRLMAIANLGTGLAAAFAGVLGPVIDAAGFTPALLISAAVSAAAVIPLLSRSAPMGRPTETPA